MSQQVATRNYVCDVSDNILKTGPWGPELIWHINVTNVWIINKINVTQIQVNMKLRGLHLERADVLQIEKYP